MNTQSFYPFQLESSWQKVLKTELEKPYIQELAAFVEGECAKGFHVYPPKKLIFSAFQKTPFDKVKVVIVGQDPYHGPGEAEGLCFSVPDGVPLPPSLKNIFKEMTNDLGIPQPDRGSLAHWAEQGVLLLNATLTVQEDTPLSHHGKGWEKFTDAVIDRLIEREDPVVFVLWGKSAQKKCQSLEQLPSGSKHTVLTAAHPSPFSVRRGFFGCNHFSKINEILKSFGKSENDIPYTVPFRSPLALKFANIPSFFLEMLINLIRLFSMMFFIGVSLLMPRSYRDSIFPVKDYTIYKQSNIETTNYGTQRSQTR